jgi:NADPH:quinone reductase-like Zn-dependent oxidoreductase
VIDYTKQDFTTTGAKYDLIVDTAGTAPFERSRRALKPNGCLLGIVGTLSEMLKIPWIALTSDKRIVAGPVGGTAEDLRFLATLAKSGQFMPLIDRGFPFEQMADAHRYFEAGHKGGNIVITV